MESWGFADRLFRTDRVLMISKDFPKKRDYSSFVRLDALESHIC